MDWDGIVIIEEQNVMIQSNSLVNAIMTLSITI